MGGRSSPLTLAACTIASSRKSYLGEPGPWWGCLGPNRSSRLHLVPPAPLRLEADPAFSRRHITNVIARASTNNGAEYTSRPVISCVLTSSPPLPPSIVVSNLCVAISSFGILANFSPVRKGKHTKSASKNLEEVKTYLAKIDPQLAEIADRSVPSDAVDGAEGGTTAESPTPSSSKKRKAPVAGSTDRPDKAKKNVTSEAGAGDNNGEVLSIGQREERALEALGKFLEENGGTPVTLLTDWDWRSQFVFITTPPFNIYF